MTLMFILWLGKKGKDTPAPDAPPSVAIPQKPPTDMIKRGEEDLNSKYISKFISYIEFQNT